MRKINYPYINEKEKLIFLNSFFDSISTKLGNQPEICNEIKKIDNSWDLKKLITADFIELLDFAKRMDSNKIVTLNHFFKSELNKIKYLYIDFQRIIADFFINEKLNIKTCYYCNIDFINPFNQFVEYKSVNDFIKYATELEWIELISEVKGKNIYNFIKSKSNCSVNDFMKIPKVGKGAIQKIKIDNINNLKKYKDHFTLDHILPKSKYPYLSISLFNLIPSCYSCNSKFKGTKEFDDLDFLCRISPSSETFDLDKLLEFKLNFDVTQKDFEEKIEKIREIKDFKIELTNTNSEKEIDIFLDMFALKGRYNYHKSISLDLIEKRKMYSDSQLAEIEKIFSENKINIDKETLKKQIFGSVIFNEDENNEPFAKYKKDIAKQLGLI